MKHAIACVRVNHLNIVLENFEAGLAHFRDLYGAEFLMDIPQKEWHAGLFQIGGVIFELFAPYQFLLNARYGAHYLGIEYQADMAAVRAAVTAHDIRIARDIGVALHTHPQDCFGIAFEFYDGEFHNRDYEILGGAKMRPVSHWSEEHGLSVTGLHAYTVAVQDIDAARRFFQSFLGASIAYEVPRPALAARTIGLAVAGSTVELITSVGEGPLAAHLHRYGEGIYSTVFAVRDLAQARGYFAGRGIALEPGGAPGSFAVPAAVNQGVIFEFTA